MSPEEWLRLSNYMRQEAEDYHERVMASREIEVAASIGAAAFVFKGLESICIKMAQEEE